MKRGHVPQPVRYTFLLLELALLLAVNRLAFASWLPGSDPSGLWFYAALFGLILGQRLDTPFFTTPAGAVLYAIPSLVGLFQISDDSWVSGSPWAHTAKDLMAAWIVLVLVVSSIAIWFQSAESQRLKNLALAARQLSASLGAPQAFFSVILFLVLAAFPPPTANAVLAVGFIWAVSVPFSLLDYVFTLYLRVRLALTAGVLGSHVAEVESFQLPGQLTFRTSSEGDLRPGAVVAFRDSASGARLSLIIGQAGRHEAVLFRAFDLGKPTPDQDLSVLEIVEPMQGMLLSETVLSDGQKQTLVAIRDHCIGFVAPETDIARLLIDITAARDLAAGRLVTTHCGAQVVYYQLTDGLTKEQIVQNKNTNGYVRAEAMGVGIWVKDEARFKPLTWVPTPRDPVSLVEEMHGAFDVSQIGTFPNSDFAVKIKDLAQLVTHNTAILGILGVGKSTLAMELVERIVRTGCKVIALDLTDQYATELAPLLNAEYQRTTITALQAIGPPGKIIIKKNVEEGGSKIVFAQAVQQQIEQFMRSAERLLIINPASFEVWRQDSKPYGDTASMASLTSCEITQIVSEGALNVAQQMGRTDAARLCLVYEEAHSLIPEWNAAAADGDKTATNGTSRAILQGRKYGLGCLVVTQRTASVTKTILNQCNSVFAMRSFDDTSKEFLSNYIGRGYATLLPNLPERHAIFFGRASSCENPVHIQLNDRSDFIRHFRAG